MAEDFITHAPLWTALLQREEAAKSPEHLAWLNYRLEFLYSRPVCSWVTLLRERNERDLARQGDPDFPFYYSHAAADHVVAFFDSLSHSKGEWAGKPFTLDPWQEYDCIRQLFGWLRKDTHTRRFNVLWLEVGKKNGKSTLGAGIGLYLLAGDNEPGAEVYSAATQLEQAKIIHSEATRMARRSADLATHLVVHRNNISVPVTGSKYEPISGDSDGLDGVNPHGALADEIHRWKQRDLWDVLEQSMATRREPLLAAFTTAGTGRTSFCFQQRTYMQQVLLGVLQDDCVWPYIATLDGWDSAEAAERDDPFNPDVWVKANPSLGTALKASELQRQADKAQSSVAQQNSFMRFRMNVWTEQAVRWLPMAQWDMCAGDWPRDDAGQLVVDDMLGAECYGGLDMATTIDIAAFVLAFPRGDETCRLLPFFFLPEDSMTERWKRDKVPYPQWTNDGLIETTPGDAIDYDYVRDRIIEICSVYDCREIAFDPYSAIATAQQLEKAGLTMVQMRQGFLSMSGPSKLMEIKVRRKQIEHGGNKVLRWMASNVAILRDHTDNIRPSKDKSTEKIDGIVASIMAVSRAALRGNAKSVYEERGLLHVRQ